jgi:protein-S-isoprenylcysteine O-methyltransferase Ste14
MCFVATPPTMVQVILIFLIFAFVHSITVTRWFKHICKQRLGDTFMRVWYRALYNGVSIVTVGIASYFIHRIPDHAIWIAPLWLRWIMNAMQLVGLAFGALAFEYLDGAEFMGIRQVGRYLARGEVSGNSEGLTQKELVTSGVYGIVRHPLYLAGIVIFTFNPEITVNGLAIAVLADLYFLFGVFIEERRFLHIFGDQYQEYMKRVPRLIPRLGRSRGRAKE